jgi:hypothetical protein
MRLNAHGDTTDCSRGVGMLARLLPPLHAGPVQSHPLCELSSTKRTLRELYIIYSLESNSFGYKNYYEEV